MDIPKKKRFGRRELIVNHLVQETEQSPFVRNNNVKTFFHFYMNIVNLVATIELIKITTYLVCPQLMLQKLSYGMQLS